MMRSLMATVAASLALAVTTDAPMAQRSRSASPPQSPALVTTGVEARITPHRPYSADAVTETVQVLADGNRITRTSLTKVYRDSAGRTRRQVFGKGDKPGTITISDPVAHVSYVLDPDEKTASKAAGTIALPTIGAAGTGRGRIAATAPLAVPSTPPATMTAGHAPGRPLPPPPPPAPAAGEGSAMIRRSAGEPENRKTEDLGVQNIEGIMATGTRTVTTIPAGQIGNAQEMRIVSEQWFSDELQVLVMTKHSDPRSGETTYRLRNILRAEPDPTLFSVPSDYTIQNRRIRQ